jgi:hypothetical protein
VKKTAAAFTEAFNAGDAAAVAAFWTKDGEYVGPDGESLRGRDESTSVGSAAEYAEQATQFADRGREATPTEDEQWQPLGVFGMVQGEETTAQHIFQLAVNPAGVVRGNYYDALADNTIPVYGTVDRGSQRAAWSIGEKREIVYEAGLNNLTQSEAPVLVHYGNERTEQMLLVRLEEPQETGR